MTEELNTNQFSAEVPKYASGDAYLKITSAYSGDLKKHVIYVGKPQSSPQVSATNLSSKPATVTITDCFGGPSWRVIFAADGDGHKKGDSAGSPTVPHILTVVVVQEPQGNWMALTYNLALDKPC
ncbi:MAG: hypothetical protein AUG49_24590 [Catenulispora sp. 13_1_20CM_3_70_7]|nr:hypothetical protein [Catenulisporales bacterium]OLE20620.1 MAG: hypothetical protein AUG49_24590 [Catenulispora sp. 13_1_20CM_3_70_7]